MTNFKNYYLALIVALDLVFRLYIWRFLPLRNIGLDNPFFEFLHQGNMPHAVMAMSTSES